MKNNILQIQQKRLPKAHARLTEAVLHAIDMSQMFAVFFYFFLNDPSFLHCQIVAGVKTYAEFLIKTCIGTGSRSDNNFL